MKPAGAQATTRQAAATLICSTLLCVIGERATRAMDVLVKELFL